MGFSRIHCGTSTAESLLRRSGYQLTEAIVFTESEVVPTDLLAFCVEAALTYHRRSPAAVHQGEPQQ